MKILVVDDSPVDRLLASRLLTEDGPWEVVEATNGKEALGILESSDVAVVVTDIQMPEMNGLELLNAVHARRPHLPVVLMTARGNEEIAVAALQQGAASYVPKRRLATELRRTVDHIWNLASAEEANTELSRRQTHFESRYEIENNLQLLMAIPAELLGKISNFWDNDTALRMQVSVAVEEALTNAYFYGSLGLAPLLKSSNPVNFYKLVGERKTSPEFCDRRISVCVNFSHRQAKFIVADEGSGFDVTSLADMSDLQDLDAVQGRGVRLMKTFMDEVQYNSKGNEVTLIKNRP